MIQVESLAAVGHAYARVRRAAGLPAYKGDVELRLSDAEVLGPAVVEVQGHLYTIFIGGLPAPC